MHIVLVASALLMGCDESLIPREQIVDLRVLGVKLDPPSAAPGDSVSAEALIVDPLGEGFTQQWYACMVPVSAQSYFSEAPDGAHCAINPPYGTPLGADAPVTIPVPSDFLTLVMEQVGAAGADLSPEVLEYILGITGWYMRVTLVVDNPAGTRQIEVQKRLVITEATEKNQNPSPPLIMLEEVDSDAPPAPLIVTGDENTLGGCLSPSSPLQVFDPGVYRISPVNLPDPTPTYEVIDFIGGLQTRPETYFFSWFTTVPGLSKPVSKSPDEHPVSFRISEIDRSDLTSEDGDPLANPVIPIWVVVRDGRGGTNWCKDTVPYVAPF